MKWKPYLLLENGEEIKVDSVWSGSDEDGDFLRIHLHIKYLNYFSSQEKQIKEVYFKGFRKKSLSYSIRTDVVPEYSIENNELFLTIGVEVL